MRVPVIPEQQGKDDVKRTSLDAMSAEEWPREKSMELNADSLGRKEAPGHTDDSRYEYYGDSSLENGSNVPTYTYVQPTTAQPTTPSSRPPRR